MEISVETVTKAPRTLPFKVGSRLLARNTAVNMAGQIIPLVVGVATMSYVIRHLGPDRFGLLSIAWLVVGYFTLLDFGIGPATTKFVAELLGKGEIERLPALVWTALLTQTGFGVVAGLLFAAGTPVLTDHLLKIPPYLRSEAHWVFLILAVSLPIGMASGTFQGVLCASQRFDLVNVISIPTMMLYYLLPAAVLALGFGLRAIVLSLVLSRLVAFGGYILFSLRLYPVIGRVVTYHRSLVRSLLGFGSWFTASSLVLGIHLYADRFLIGILSSVAAVGFYTPPFMIASKMTILPGSLTAALFPAFSTSQGRGDGEWIRNAMIRSIKYILLIVGAVALALAFFARPILTLWVGARFAAEGTTVLQILAMGVLLSSLALVPYNLLQGIGRPDLPAKFYLLEVPIHLGFLWFLTTRYGLPGAALAWAIRMGLDLVLHIVAACRLTKISPRVLVGTDLQRTITSLVALTLGFSVLWSLSHALLTHVLGALLLAAGFSLGAWRFVLDLEERGQVRQWLKRRQAVV